MYQIGTGEICMNDFDILLRDVYRHDPLMQKIKEIYNKFKNIRQGLDGKHIVKNEKQIYSLDIGEKFEKNYNPFFECLLEVKFRHKDSFKLYSIIIRKIKSINSPYIKCRKSYLEKISRLDHQGFLRCLSELKEKNMLLESRDKNLFIFTPVLSPLTWKVSESELEKIEKEIKREIDRLDKKWIQEKTE
jgi:hypothetical protein